MKRNLIIAGVVILIFAVSIFSSHRQAVRLQRKTEIRARHILIRVDLSDPVKMAQAEQRIEEIRDRIEAGDDFARLAKEYSEDPMSAPMGGDLGYLEEGEFDQQFGDAVAALDEGEVSDIVQTIYGYHIIQLLDRRGPQAQR
jgi:parvulin-like peptidyl-prolyl isomerase